MDNILTQEEIKNLLKLIDCNSDTTYVAKYEGKEIGRFSKKPDSFNVFASLFMPEYETCLDGMTLKEVREIITKGLYEVDIV